MLILTDGFNLITKPCSVSEMIIEQPPNKINGVVHLPPVNDYIQRLQLHPKQSESAERNLSFQVPRNTLLLIVKRPFISIASPDLVSRSTIQCNSGAIFFLMLNSME